MLLLCCSEERGQDCWEDDSGSPDFSLISPRSDSGNGVGRREEGRYKEGTARQPRGVWGMGIPTSSFSWEASSTVEKMSRARGWSSASSWARAPSRGNSNSRAAPRRGSSWKRVLSMVLKLGAAEAPRAPVFYTEPEPGCGEEGGGKGGRGCGGGSRSAVCRQQSAAA